MVEPKADETDQAVEHFRDAFKKFNDYIDYLETIPEAKRTMKENELVKKWGGKKKRLKSINPLG